jgi:hypothetical protein
MGFRVSSLLFAASALHDTLPSAAGALPEHRQAQQLAWQKGDAAATRCRFSAGSDAETTKGLYFKTSFRK